MATQMTRFRELPGEMRNLVWDQAVLPGPGVHFLRPNDDYNGSFLEPAAEIIARDGLNIYGPGVSEVSRFSAAFWHARLRMASPEGKAAVERMIRERGMTHIIINPATANASLGAISTLPTDTSMSPRFFVDKINDMFVVSTFGSLHFPNDYFSGAFTCEHLALKDIKILGISMPRCDRPEGDQSCRDCGADFTERPGPVMKRLEFCDPCVGSWTSLLLDVERVYLIVPGIRRARADDEAEVYRFGVRPIIEAALSALPRRPSRYRQLWHRNLPAYYPRHGMFLQGTRSTEAFGPEGPRSFHGSGITLFEVPSGEVPSSARNVMKFMFLAACRMRSDFAREDREFFPLPKNPVHCGGLVEFRFLSYEA